MKLTVSIIPWTKEACGYAVGKCGLKSGHSVSFTYEGYLLVATIIAIWPRGRKPKIRRTFQTTRIECPTVHLSHELPIFAAFLLECHQRLSKSVRDNKFNPKALENPE